MRRCLIRSNSVRRRGRRIGSRLSALGSGLSALALVLGIGFSVSRIRKWRRGRKKVSGIRWGHKSVFGSRSSVSGTRRTAGSADFQRERSLNLKRGECREVSQSTLRKAFVHTDHKKLRRKILVFWREGEQDIASHGVVVAGVDVDHAADDGGAGAV